MKRTLIPGGYIEGGQYLFFLTDHLGSTHLLADKEAMVYQQVNYYPFGMAFADGVAQDVQPYKFTGKELDNKHKIGIYDSKARQQDTQIPRFLSMDPLAEKYYSWSPYVYVMNNPLRLIDPTGMSSDTTKTDYFPKSISDLDAVAKIQVAVDFIAERIRNILFKEKETPEKETHLAPRQLPSYVGLTLSTDAILGGGYGLDFTFGGIRGDGIFLNVSLRAGTGLSLGASAGISLGWYTGEGKPTATSLSGIGFYEDFGVGQLGITSFQSIGLKENSGLPIWQGFTTSYSFLNYSPKISSSLSSSYSGSVGVSYTTSPLYLYKKQ